MKPIKKIKSNNLGFTLIELMITVAIVAILTSIAIPSYKAYIIKTNRTEIKADLEAIARELEKRFVIGFSYSAANGGAGGDPAANLYPAYGPTASGRQLYKFSLALTDSTYTVTATPQAGQQAGDGKLTVSYTGERCWHKDNGGCKDW